MNVSQSYSLCITLGFSGVLIGVGIGWFFAKIKLNQNILIQQEKQVSLEKALQTMHLALRQAELMKHQGECEQRDLSSRLIVAEERLSSLSYLRQECRQLNRELQLQKEINNNQEIKLREVITRFEESKLSAKEKENYLINNEKHLSEHFENVANRIFSYHGQKVDEQNQKSLNQLLIPLREQIEGFRHQVQNNLSQEARERHTLINEIQTLKQLNASITQETINLTRALKGDNKIHGDWGEVILSKLLASSGLREGHEFETQVQTQQEDGHRRQPDVIIRLPKGKDVIIDAKTSLVAYERYFNSTNDADRQLALMDHINSIRIHMKTLGRKDYHKLPGFRSLDYVLMFVPIETAFMVAINQQPELITEALTHNIMLVSPTTLLVALRTINNLWRYEYQSNNAKHIAERASRLYDKLRLFINDINDIGQCLDKAQNNYQLARNKLLEGRGNILRQAEEFHSLGVEIKRPITFPSNTYAVLSSESDRNYRKKK
ncbi:DNA recombination protein RmuC [Sodalis sp. CWE]|uniref:DNA recombination protein RmuC n=1 Tax=Sodalis sp. CWE TaxID=2803816 RepID=UPI001C7DFB61|nr:DNA recombination protein RmuC [Sodalis sp. CWE]MBX4180860.1 DNA recombination protein RmuC [Sodalis sp. CWE]